MSGLKKEINFAEKKAAVDLWLQKRKRRSIIIWSILNVIWILGTAFCFLGLLVSGETIKLGIYFFFLITFFLVESVIVVSFILDIKENTLKISNDTIHPTTIIEIKNAIGRRKWIIVDEELKKFIYKNGLKYSEIYNFSEFVRCDLYEKNYQQLESSAGSAAVGGFLFGTTGAIIGSSVSRKIQDINSGLSVLICLNNEKEPLIIIDYIRTGASYDTSSQSYIQKKMSAELFCSEFIQVVRNDNQY